MIKQIITFLHMGGYAWYIWPCYAVLILGLAFFAYAAFRRHATVKQQIFMQLQKNDQNPAA